MGYTNLDIEGNVLGNLTGDVTGDLTGDVTGNISGDVNVIAIKVEDRVPTVTGATTGTISAGTTFVNVTSAGADNIIILPAPVVGLKITLINNATGYELRSSAPATIGINGGTGASAESAVAASVIVKVECVSATNWIGSVVSAAGVVTVLEVAS